MPAGLLPKFHQCSDTSWVPQNSTQFWYYLPGDSNRSHSLRAWSHKTIPTAGLRVQVQVVTCAVNQQAINQRFTSSLFGSVSLLEWVTEIRKTLYSLDYWLITKDIRGYKSTARWRRGTEQTRDVGRVQCFCALLSHFLMPSLFSGP